MYISYESGKKQVTFISEPNLYRVIFRSNKAEAVKFQNWVFDEVLPSIRKTGSYSQQPTLSDKTIECLAEQFVKTSTLIQQLKKDYLPFLENVSMNKGGQLRTLLTLLHYDMQDNAQDLAKLLPSDVKENRQHPIIRNLEMAYYADDLHYLLKVA